MPDQSIGNVSTVVHLLFTWNVFKQARIALATGMFGYVMDVLFQPGEGAALLIHMQSQCHEHHGGH